MKKLLHKDGTVSVLASVIAIIIGLLFGLVVLYIINAPRAAQSFYSMLTIGFSEPAKFAKVLYQTAPLIMTGLSVGFAFKTGLFNIGATGQYTVGAFAALVFAIQFQMPWYVCIIAAMLAGAVWGMFPGLFKALFNVNEVITSIMFNWIGLFPGLFKALFNVNEVITSIMFNWIGLYLVNEIIYGNGTGVMYDSRNTRTWNLRRMEGAEGVTIPDFGLNDMFQTNSTTIAIFLSIVVAILIWVVLDKTTFGYELKAVGLNKNAARYAGINEKKNLVRWPS